MFIIGSIDKGNTTKKRGKNHACTSAVGQKPLKWALISAVPWLAAEMKMAVNNFFFQTKQGICAVLTAEVHV